MRLRMCLMWVSQPHQHTSSGSFPSQLPHRAQGEASLPTTASTATFSEGCDCVRCTIDNDICWTGFQRRLYIAASTQSALIWVSLPCAGACWCACPPPYVNIDCSKKAMFLGAFLTLEGAVFQTFNEETFASILSDKLSILPWQMEMGSIRVVSGSRRAGVGLDVSRHTHAHTRTHTHTHTHSRRAGAGLDVSFRI